MTSSRPKLILASASPRRRAMLENLGFELLIRPAELDETPLTGEDPLEYVLRLAREKAAAIWRALPSELQHLPILAADTTVVLGTGILGKPADAAEARTMLATLSGRQHSVLSGVCLRVGEREFADTETTEVWFDTLTAAELDTYVSSGEPLDKAGGYAIQGRAAWFIPRIEGSYSNVVGLPLTLVRRLLTQSGAVS